MTVLFIIYCISAAGVCLWLALHTSKQDWIEECNKWDHPNLPLEGFTFVLGMIPVINSYLFFVIVKSEIQMFIKHKKHEKHK